ncbi:MAG: class II fructose-bisphosphate aldolase [Candidatus Paceibacterota bacterium]|jgi:fructose-bisphosphate aldolase class II
MKSLLETILEAKKDKKAIGHFNVSNLETIKAIIGAAQRENVPVIIGVSEGERSFIGLRQVAALIKNYREELSFPIFLNADHTHSLIKAKQAIEAGFDAITFDLSGLPLEENIKQTKEIVAYKKSINSEVLIEGETNPIWGKSEVLSEVPKEVAEAVREINMTKPELAKQFVKETGVDLLAPATGNIHGVVKDGKSDVIIKPKIDIERIKEISKVVDVPLVLHGGSGIPEEDLKQAIEAGVSIIHINTELRLTWRNSLEEKLKKYPNEIIPYKIMPEVIFDIENLVEKKLRIFNGK